MENLIYFSSIFQSALRHAIEFYAKICWKLQFDIIWIFLIYSMFFGYLWWFVVLSVISVYINIFQIIFWYFDGVWSFLWGFRGCSNNFMWLRYFMSFNWMFLDKQIIWFSKKAEKQYHKQILLNLNLFAFSDRIYSIHFILQTVVYALQNKNKQPPKCFTSYNL